MSDVTTLPKIIDLKSRVIQLPGRVSASLASEAAVLNPDSGYYFKLNSVGAVIWSLLISPLQVSEICDRVFEEFEVSRERCEADTLKVLCELEKHGLITAVETDHA